MGAEAHPTRYSTAVRLDSVPPPVAAVAAAVDWAFPHPPALALDCVVVQSSCLAAAEVVAVGAVVVAVVVVVAAAAVGGTADTGHAEAVCVASVVLHWDSGLRHPEAYSQAVGRSQGTVTVAGSCPVAAAVVVAGTVAVIAQPVDTATACPVLLLPLLPR